MLVHEQLSQGEGPTSPVGTQHTPTVIETSPQLQNISITYKTTRTRSRRIGIRIPQSNVLSHVANEAITKEMHDGLGRATTTASSLEAEQGSGNISKTQTKATPSRLSSPRTSSEEGNTSRSGEGSMQLLELMEICTKLSDKVTALEDELRSTKAIYNKSLITLTKRVKNLENNLKLKRRSTIVNSSKNKEASLDIKDPSKQGRMIELINQDENLNLVKSSKQGEAHETAEHEMESDVDFSTASPQNDDDKITLAKTLVNIKRSTVKDKGKAIMHESKPPKKIKKRVQVQMSIDEELAKKELQKQLDEREEVASKSSQAHDIDWSDPTVIRYHTLHNRSFFVAEVRKNMCMYLKNQGGYKLSHFKGMKYEEIKPIFERVWYQNQAFIPKDSEIEKEVMNRSGFIQKQYTEEEEEKKKDEESSKQVEEETVQKEDVIPEQVVKESSRKAEGKLKRKASKPREDKDKRQKNVTPLAFKSPIVGWKSYYKEDVGYYEIHRVDGSYKTYIFFSQMLNDFDREDLIVLYRLFNEKYASTRPGKVSIHMLVAKKYPLLQDTLTRMLRWKLHVNYNVTKMAYELLRLISCMESKFLSKILGGCFGGDRERLCEIEGKQRAQIKHNKLNYLKMRDVVINACVQFREEECTTKVLKNLTGRYYTGKSTTIGIADHAQDHLGDVVYVEMREFGLAVAQGSGLDTVSVNHATAHWQSMADMLNLYHFWSGPSPIYIVCVVDGIMLVDKDANGRITEDEVRVRNYVQGLVEGTKTFRGEGMIVLFLGYVPSWISTADFEMALKKADLV
ncbi:ribonuclease H-like domain-containing protein [Tanacetum coccineum]|uniref:Ribonuclease H-like domain-containing protein n=1 Tax=Tanacetum coccineum TaxID=301880 RepID=A0ABQ5BMI6_9ASTR